MNIVYEDIFQDKFIFESVGRNVYYSDAYPVLVRKREKKATRFIKVILNNSMAIKAKRSMGENNVIILEPMFEHLFAKADESINFYLLHDSGIYYRKYKNSKYRQFFYREWQSLIDRSFLSHDMSFANRAAEDVQEFYIRNNIKAIVMGNDKRFIERLLLIVAQNYNIPVIVIQHGVYSDQWSFGKLKTSNTADYFWAWSNYIRDCYIKRFNKNPEKVKVIGYPFEYIKDYSVKRNAVLFIGNQYRNADGEKTFHLKIAKSVLEICKNSGFDFVYRPHPGEIIDEDYGELSSYVSQGRTLLEDFSFSKVAVGDISTAMVEAALSGLQVVQVLWNDRTKEVINDHTYDFTIKVNNNYNEIEQAIKSGMFADVQIDINNDYLYINPCICDNVSDYINEVIGLKR